MFLGSIWDILTQSNYKPSSSNNSSNFLLSKLIYFSRELAESEVSLPQLSKLVLAPRIYKAVNIESSSKWIIIFAKRNIYELDILNVNLLGLLEYPKISTTPN